MGGDIQKKLSYKKEDFGNDNHATYKYLWSIQKNSIIIYYFNNDSKRYKVIYITYKKKVIKQGEYYDNNNSFIFNEDNHNYKIIHKNDIAELFIDGKSFNYLYNEELKKEKESERIVDISSIRYCNCNEMSFEENSAMRSVLSTKKYMKISSEASSEGSYLINVRFFYKEYEEYDILYPKNDLSGILNLCLIKYISEFFNNYKIIQKISPNIKEIILKLRNNINFSNDRKTNVYFLLKENKGKNILIYSQYVNFIINKEEINKLVNILDYSNKDLINKYWRSLSKYTEYTSFFEQQFIKDLKNTIFDYSLINLGIIERKDEEDYKSVRDLCPNMVKRILYHGSQIEPISSILTSEFKYTRRAFYGMGIYFSDLFDYISFYCGGTNFGNRRAKFGQTIPINSTFSFIASEVFYDKTKFKQIEDKKLYVPDLYDFPTHKDLERKYPDKMVKPNGIHFIRVDYDGNPITEKDFLNYKYKGKFYGSEYAITEMYQIFPIYSLTLKRNEYFVLWRDPNFFESNIFSNYLLERKLFCTEKANMNIYFENSIEDALKFLCRRKFNKVILISNIGLDLSGKRFVEVARKIFGFDLMVLFFSVNEEHLKWIQKFPNCLYTNTSKIYEEYITNFNENGLKELKKKVEKEYKIKLMEFSDDFLSYPNFKDEVEYSSLNFTYFNQYFRHVIIYNKSRNYYLEFKNIKLKNKNEYLIWHVTIIGNEITLFSNGYYLDINEDNEGVLGTKYMKVWKFGIINYYYYYFIYPNKKIKNLLSVEGNEPKINKDKADKTELFQLIDVAEDEYNI